MNPTIQTNTFHHQVKSLVLAFVLLCLFVPDASAQNAKHWCFGNYAGLDFTSSVPTVYTDSRMNTPEGCASIAWASNNHPKLYTNGRTLWDNSHAVVANDLNGSINSTQSSLILSHPMSGQQHIYVFTTDEINGSNGLQYTILQDNGGAMPVVYSKNNPLLATASERLTVALHCNRLDFWVITHEWNSNAFYAYKLTEDGLDTVPVISRVGSIHQGNKHNGEGYLKASLQGNFLAQAIMGEGKVELFRFDNQTGVVHDPVSLPGIPNAYGAEFTMGEGYFYASSASGGIYQYYIGNYSASAINASKSQILQSSQLIGALQIAKDQKIYVSVDNKYYLGCIVNPERGGLSCAYDPNYVYLNGKKTEAGLPPEIPKTIIMEIIANVPCVGDTSFFSVNNLFPNYDSLFWDFGDFNSTDDTSTAEEPWYIYPDPGNYDVTLTIHYCGEVDTLYKDVLVIRPPSVNLGPDTSFCENTSYVLDAGVGPDYLWSTGSTSATLQVQTPGLYWVEASNRCGSNIDSVVIENIWPKPFVQLPPDSNICFGDSIILDAGDSNYIYVWQGLDTTRYYTANAPITYQVIATNHHNCFSSDNFTLTFTYPPDPDLGNDTTICIGSHVLFDAGYGEDYYWSNGSASQTLTVDSTSVVWVEVSNKCGSVTDSISILVDECEKIIFIPNAFTPNQDGRNEEFFPYVQNVQEYHFHVYNRWGKLVFESKTPFEGWDGKLDGENCPQDAYIWSLEFRDYNGFSHIKHGYVILYR